MRVVSECLESNGSTSMASTCGSTLALMDAGVPLKAPVAGVAMGLVLEDDGDWAVLTDILGDEDHLGDMDFKVAGSEKGITSLQMDIKVAGITQEIFEVALRQAKEGRAHILGEMSKALSSTRTELSAHAPRIETVHTHTVAWITRAASHEPAHEKWYPSRSLKSFRQSAASRARTN